MEHHHTLSDNEFLHRFESLTLNPKWFTHEAHLRIAWVYLDRCSVPEACEMVFSGIRRFDDTFGIGNKYHKTLTFAAVRIVDHFKRKTRGEFKDMITTYARIKLHFKALVEQHYDPDIYTNDLAREHYVEPIQPFD